MKTKAIFFIHKKNKEVFVVFPEIREYYKISKKPMFMSYSNLGQHSPCSLGYIQESILALRHEYKDLKAELINVIGYDLDVFNNNYTDTSEFFKNPVFTPLSEKRRALRLENKGKQGFWIECLILNELKNISA